jgi:hypothetical protein
MEINEFGPGLGFWIAVGLGLIAGVVTLAAGAGWLIAAIVWVVVSVALVLMLS